MKYLVCAILLIFAACKSTPKASGQEIIRPRKAAFIERMLSEIYTLHFDINTPNGHPSKIEENIVKGWAGERKDTIKREYIFENDRLVKVFDNEFGVNSVYTLKYDNQGRRTLIDQQTPNGSFHKDTFEYHLNGPFDAVREHFMFNKPEERLRLKYYGNSDSLLISSGEGPEMCYFREVNDTLFVQRIWRNYSDIILSNKIEAYDKNNQLVRITTIDNRRKDRVVNFVYDNRGNQIAREEKDVDNIIGGSAEIIAVSAPQTYRTVYEFDSIGNWIKKTEKSGNGKYNAVSTRKITYSQ